MRPARPGVVALALCCVAGFLTAACRAGPTSSAEAARQELRTLIEDAAGATASRYGLTDDRGNVMDGAKVLADPEIGGFAAVSHSFRDVGQTFLVNLATSTDLINRS